MKYPVKCGHGFVNGLANSSRGEPSDSSPTSFAISFRSVSLSMALLYMDASLIYITEPFPYLRPINGTLCKYSLWL